MCRQLVDGPLVIGVAAEFGGDDTPVGGDQEIGGQAEAAVLRSEWGQRFAIAVHAAQRGGDATDDGRPGMRVEQCARGGFDAEFAVQLTSRVGDQVEGELGGFLQNEYYASIAGAGTAALARSSATAFPLLAETAAQARTLSADTEFDGGVEILLRGLSGHPACKR